MTRFILCLTLALSLMGCSSNGENTITVNDCADKACGEACGDAQQCDASGNCIASSEDFAALCDAPDATEDDAGVDDSADVSSEVEPEHIFNYGLEEGQGVSAAPFPNDMLRDADGNLAIMPLGDDPLLGTMAASDFLGILDAKIATKGGFGAITPAMFFVNETLDTKSFQGNIHMVTLAGPESGRVVQAEADWLEFCLDACDSESPRMYRSMSVRPAFGDYMMAESTYGIVITSGVSSKTGNVVTRHPAMDILLAETAPSEASAFLAAAHERYQLLREWLALPASAARNQDVIVATVFTTGDVKALPNAVFDALDGYALQPPTLAHTYDEEAGEFKVANTYDSPEDLDSHFGIATPPFDIIPGFAGTGVRDEAEILYGERYEGGTMHQGIGRVITGSYFAPALALHDNGEQVSMQGLKRDGDAITWTYEEMIPFTLFLCESHADNVANLPVALFQHGGTASRLDAVGWAVLNCQLGIATIAADLAYHGGRTTFYADKENKRLLPTNPDNFNAYTGLSEGDEGYVPDYVGEYLGAAETGAQLFGLAQRAQPNVLESIHLGLAADMYTLVRQLKEGDWSNVLDGLSFDPGHVYLEALSFGASFAIPLLVFRQPFRGAITSSESGMLISSVATSAPSNGQLGAGYARLVIGLKTPTPELQAGGWRDPIVNMIQWLGEQGDPYTYTPYLMRHRLDDFELPIIATTSTWDHTLHAGFQMSFYAAAGFPVYSRGNTWSIGDASQPGFDLVNATEYTADPISANATFGDRSHSAALTFADRTCHGMSVSATCDQSFEVPYPPITPLETPIVKESLICGVHAQAKAFLSSLLAEATHPDIVRPHNVCEDLYAP